MTFLIQNSRWLRLSLLSGCFNQFGVCLVIMQGQYPGILCGTKPSEMHFRRKSHVY